MFEDQEKRRLDLELAKEYHLLVRDDRLERIAQDIVTHFVGRGQVGKAMVVSIDKATAVRMYDKVQAHWRAHLAKLRERAQTAPTAERERQFDSIAGAQRNGISCRSRDGSISQKQRIRPPRSRPSRAMSTGSSAAGPSRAASPPLPAISHVSPRPI
jgi:hypothetical protein